MRWSVCPSHASRQLAAITGIHFKRGMRGNEQTRAPFVLKNMRQSLQVFELHLRYTPVFPLFSRISGIRLCVWPSIPEAPCKPPIMSLRAFIMSIQTRGRRKAACTTQAHKMRS
jgi:hypothetical protein